MSTRTQNITETLPNFLAPMRPVAPEIERADSDNAEPTHRVILYDDDWHGVDEVVLQVQKATGCDLNRATAIMLEAHNKGRAICFRGERERCHKVAGILRQIRLQVEVDCD